MNLHNAKLAIDVRNGLIELTQGNEVEEMSLSSPEGFRVLSDLWLRSGWDNKHVYSFTWMGRPIIQLPEDMIRMAELVYALKPSVIIETGIAHGGSLIYYASLLQNVGGGKVIGVDIEVRPHNKQAIDRHEMRPFLEIVEGDSVGEDTVKMVAELVESYKRDGSHVMVILDSCHTKDHVLRELIAYSRFVTKDSYIIAMDGIMKDVAGAPRTQEDWSWDNPVSAVHDFLQENSGRFQLIEPTFQFNEGNVKDRVTYAPNAILQRIK
ncbi:cephalosporin hydroxylase family protein [Alicyclobacillus dauci]|uniref:Cephalosporin hydroxylase family protein n=1 Tax=Alicyclobacillus dauci TaxID=1475485 RepID=A0ABY6Z4E1_9BACL|nr:CmcI family methyltransferase [Alicyclobacillus dauci]WAH37697.1 cephalosporin hydroxylase family protein [Alicyclobacillus dauci]